MTSGGGGGTPHHRQGKPLSQQGKTKALSIFLCLLQSLKSLFPSLVLASLQAQAVHAQEQRAHFYLTHVQPDPAEEALASNSNDNL